MAKDFFEGLSELGKGIGKKISEGVEKVAEKAEEIIAKDEFDAKIKSVEKELNVLLREEAVVYEKIGRLAVEQNGTEVFGEVGEELAALKEKQRELNIQLEATLLAKEEAKVLEDANELDGYGFEVCLACGAKLKENAKFCSACGQRVQPLDFDFDVEKPQTKNCPVCGDEDPIDAVFCSECGHKYE
ncbi:MAG: zinc ribbon domain-containing protein [Anaerofustis stercorihominis]|nr:zinc ribbon domain-containing protein [Anaerofustis stercorihominis]